MSLLRSPAFPIHPRFACGRVFFLLVFSLQGIGIAADVDAPSREAVEKAIDQAQGYLQSLLEANQRRNKQDNWETAATPVASHAGFRGARWGELTGLSLLAQLSGLQNNRVKFAPELESFMNATVTSPRAIALRLRLCDFLPSPSPHDFAQVRTRRVNENAELLQKTLTGDLAGSSELPPAFVAAIRASADLPEDYWKRSDAAWRKAQRPDGSWFDRDADPPAVRVATTAKGVTALLLAQDVLLSAHTDCNGTPPDTNLDGALAWLDHHVDDALADPESMFALAGAGGTSGRRMFGTTNWYPRGAADLLKRQNADGSWPATPQLTGADPTAKLVPETAYAILFLIYGSRGTALMKLDYGLPPRADGRAVEASGDRRPFDVTHFADRADRELCGGVLDWERVNLQMSPRDLSDAPLLYISGSEALAFTPQEQDTLRLYVRHGGMILGNADCGSVPFADSFMALGKRLFPDYAFRELTPDAGMFANTPYQPTKWPASLKVLGLSNGVRELMVLAPAADLGKDWQARKPAMRDAPIELGFAILQYANGSRFWDRIRGQPAWPLRNDAIKSDRTIRIARIAHADNADPEPGGWERLAIVLHDDGHADLDVTAVQLGAGKLNPRDFQVAHLTGTGTLSLNDAYRNEIEAFVNGGGTLIIDAAGGRTEFIDSAAKELSRMFPPAVPQPDASAGEIGSILEKDADVFSLHGLEIHEPPLLRRYAVASGVHGKYPRIQVIDIGRRHAVFFSPLDLSNGLVGQDTGGILGYRHEAATAIMRNLLLYAAGVR